MTVPADIQIAELMAADIDDVWEFFQQVPEGDRTFFKEPVSERDTVRGWTEANGDRRFVARGAERVVGYVALIPGVGWSRHVAELRLVVDPGLRRQGVGSASPATGWCRLDSGLTKVTVEVIAEQESTIALFTRLGFRAEALLEDHVKDPAGRFSHLIILTNRTDLDWSVLETVGLDEPLES